jgi:hypothetical protein
MIPLSFLFPFSKTVSGVFQIPLDVHCTLVMTLIGNKFDVALLRLCSGFYTYKYIHLTEHYGPYHVHSPWDKILIVERTCK